MDLVSLSFWNKCSEDLKKDWNDKIYVWRQDIWSAKDDVNDFQVPFGWNILVCSQNNYVLFEVLRTSEDNKMTITSTWKWHSTGHNSFLCSQYLKYIACDDNEFFHVVLGYIFCLNK